MTSSRYVRRFCDNCRKASFEGNKNRKARNELKILRPDGYVLVRLKNRRPDVGGWYIQEHRLVMENKLNRKLIAGEIVHHKDGNRSNNHQDNLELFVRNGHPFGIRASDLICPHCGKAYSNQ